jgi:Spy/CpxP family protein refolding chaperone
MKAGLAIFFLLGVFIVAPTPLAAQTDAGVSSKASLARTLSDSQKQAIKRIQAEAEKKAAPAAIRLAGIVRKIYENMLADKPNEKLRAALSAEMKEAAWTLLSIKGQVVRDTINVLTPAQKQLVKSEIQKAGAPADLSEVVAHTFGLADK